MKLSKSFMKKLLILVLTAFVILPIVLMVLGYPKNITTEPFSVPSESDYYEMKDTEAINSFDGVDISGISISLSDTNTDISLTGLSGEALYCINGVLKCTETGTDLSLNDSTGLYSYYCNETGGTQSTTSHATCENSVFSSTTTKFAVPKDISGTTISHETYSILHNIDSANHDDVSSIFVGFSQPYTYKRVDISNDDVSNNPYLILYDVNNGTDVSYISTACYLFNQGSLNNCNCNLADSSNCDTSTDADDNTNSTDAEQCEGVTEDYCVADFGAQVGDKLCCGQTGVVQKDDRVCPYSKPVCSGFKCGSKWGVCVEKDE